MKIEFNLSPGDVVWLMYDNKAKTGVITKCNYIRNISCVNFETVTEEIKYDVRLQDGRIVGPFTKFQLFGSKERLLKSL